MSLTAAILDALVASGASQETIIAAVKADMAEREQAAEARRVSKRKGNAERQRRFKASGKASQVTLGNAGNADNAVTPPPNDIYSNPPPVNPTKPSGLVTPKPKKHRLPDDWEPMPFKAGSQAALILIRWDPGRLERELAKFRDHHTAAGNRFEVWQAAWSKWVNGSEDFGGRNGHQQQHHGHLGKTSRALQNLGGVRDDAPM